jgi:valyl-tRNA synthetase
LRLALIQAATPGQDVPYNPDSVDAARRFGNKLWNAVRFALPHLDGVPAVDGYPERPGPENRWILSRLHETMERIDGLLEEYRFADAYGALYTFAWSEVFDWFLEMAKTPLRGDDPAETAATLGVVLRDLLKAFHPVIPYLTEELWSEVVGDGLLAGSTWPEPPAYQPPEGIEVFRDLVVGIRRFRAEHGLSPRHPLDVTLVDPDGIAADWWGPQFESLASVAPRPAAEAPGGDGHTRVVAGSAQAFISLEGIVDPEAERDRLAKAIADTETRLDQAGRKLDNPQFVEKAPAEVVEKERAKAEELSARLAKLKAQFENLG